MHLVVRRILAATVSACCRSATAGVTSTLRNLDRALGPSTPRSIQRSIEHSIRACLRGTVQQSNRRSVGSNIRSNIRSFDRTLCRTAGQRFTTRPRASSSNDQGWLRQALGSGVRHALRQCQLHEQVWHGRYLRRPRHIRLCTHRRQEVRVRTAQPPLHQQCFCSLPPKSVCCAHHPSIHLLDLQNDRRHTLLLCPCPKVRATRQQGGPI